VHRSAIEPEYNCDGTLNGSGTRRLVVSDGDAIDRTVTINGLQIHYREWPAPGAEAPTLIALHGATQPSHVWDSFGAAMSDRFRILAPDLRGHGESEWAPDQRYTAGSYIDDLSAFIAHHELAHYSLLGFSLGAFVSLLFAGGRPPGLERLVAVDSGPVVAAGGEELRERLMRSRAIGFSSEDEVLQELRKMMPAADQDELAHFVRHGLEQRDDGKWVYRYDPDTLLIPPGDDDEHWGLVSQIAVPTLVIRGELSPVLPADVARRMAETITDCALVEFEGSGHALRLDQPARFLQTVGDFLR